MTSNSDREANRNAAWRWGGFVVGLLTLQVAIGVVAIVLANGDGSADVIPNYYQKALDWDDDIALQHASAKLGWQLKLGATDDRGESNGLLMQLTDQDGVPIQIASGRLRWYRHAQGGNVRSVAIPNHPGGMFTMDACFETGGLWQVLVDVTDTSGNRFTDSREIDLNSPSHVAPNHVAPSPIADSGAT